MRSVLGAFSNKPIYFLEPKPKTYEGKMKSQITSGYIDIALVSMGKANSHFSCYKSI